MANKIAPEKKEELTISDTLANFMQHHKRALTFSFAALVSAVVIFVAGNIIVSKIREKNLVEVERLSSEFVTLKQEGLSASGQADKVKAYIEALTEFASKKSGYPGARAYAILGELYNEQKEWANAEEAWTKSADKAPKIYLAPLGLFNAALAAEEQGKPDAALALFTRALSYEKTFPGAPRAGFSVGRIHEGKKDSDSALAAYLNVIEKWPLSGWAKYAQSRIISINNAAKL